MFLYIGNKNLFTEGGISIFQYSEPDGMLHFLKTQYAEVSSGFIFIDQKNARLFSVNERIECDGVPGGQVLCFKIDPLSGDLSLMSRAYTHTVLPCYLHFSERSSQLLVCNHAKRDWCLKLSCAADDTVCGKKIYDDAALEVFDVMQNGTLCGPKSFWVAPLSQKASDNPHLHSITYDEETGQFYICDTGSDMVYILALGKGGNPVLKSAVRPDIKSSAPRYGVLHPHLPVVYFNSEKQNALFVYQICEDKILPLQIARLMETDQFPETRLRQASLLLNCSGTILYTLDRKTRNVVAFSVGNDGKLSRLQVFSIPWEDPRFMVTSPDEKFLFVVCSTSRVLARAQIGGDGRLFDCAIVNDTLPSPSCMGFYTPDK